MRACRNSNATTDLSFVMGAHRLTTNTQREVINNIEFNVRDRIGQNNAAGEHLGVYQVMQSSPRQTGYFQEWQIIIECTFVVSGIVMELMCLLRQLSWVGRWLPWRRVLIMMG